MKTNNMKFIEAGKKKHNYEQSGKSCFPSDVWLEPAQFITILYCNALVFACPTVHVLFIHMYMYIHTNPYEHIISGVGAVIYSALGISQLFIYSAKYAILKWHDN